MRILVTNDDGIDSIGLHVLARAIAEVGEVVVAAPDSEYSGSGAAFGALFNSLPEVHEAHIDGLDEVWSVSGPPALCMMYARLGAFGPAPDFVVSGTNPGCNVGRSVYHSGTIGAVLTGRNGGISGVAVSQAVDSWGIEGQGADTFLDGQHWETAAQVAAAATRAMIADPSDEPLVLNLNVPNTPIEEVAGWKWTTLGTEPMRALTTIDLEAKPGHQGSYRVAMNWGEPIEASPEVDAGAVNDGYVAASFLSRISAIPVDRPSLESALSNVLS